MQGLKILIVDDEAAIRDMIRMGLEMMDYECLEAENIQDAYVIAHDKSPHLILLDWMLPGGSGIELLRRLRKDDVTAKIPVIMLTAKTAEDNKIQGLEVGADDYMIKPFAPRELAARIKAVLRRSGAIQEGEVIQIAGIKIDHSSHRVSLEGHEANLGPTEYKLLSFFMAHEDRVYSRNQLLDQIWGNNAYIDERTIDVHIRRLRKALQLPQVAKDYGDYIQTVRGAGYRFSTT